MVDREWKDKAVLEAIEACRGLDLDRRRYIIADLVMLIYGPQAPSKAGIVADHCNQEGQTEWADFWVGVADAIHDLQYRAQSHLSETANQDGAWQ